MALCSFFVSPEFRDCCPSSAISSQAVTERIRRPSGLEWLARASLDELMMLKWEDIVVDVK